MRRDEEEGDNESYKDEDYEVGLDYIYDHEDDYIYDHSLKPKCLNPGGLGGLVEE